MRIRQLSPLLGLVLAALACAQTELPGTATPPATERPLATMVVVTQTPEASLVPPSATPTATDFAPNTSTPTSQPIATATTQPAVDPLVGPGSDVYFDNRSDAQSLVWSYVNALARHEPLRAYGYWKDTPDRPIFSAMETDNANLVNTSVEIGPILADAGAGQRYFAVPALVTVERAGGIGVEITCFFLHLSSPDLQAVPPFRPLGIERITSRSLTESDNAANALATACPADAGGPMASGAPVAPDDISAERYLDDRSGGRLYPPAPGLWKTLTLEATADGILDAAILMVYEVRIRPEDKRFGDWVEAQWAKVSRALDALEGRWAEHLNGPIDMGQVAVGCALSYLDFRHGDRNWRAGRPALAAWYGAFSARDSMAQTEPVA